MSLRETTDAVDTAVRLLREQMERLAALPAGITAKEAHAIEQMRGIAAELIKVENSRTAPLVALIANRRSLSTLPQGDLQRLLDVFTGQAPPVAVVIPAVAAVPAKVSRRRK